MFFAFPHTRARFQYAHIRFFEREFGIEYTKFENKRMQEVYQAKTRKLSEISGYIVWLRRHKAFLIVPTLTSPEPSVFCEIPDWIDLEIPPDRAFVVAKGKWVYKVASGLNPLASPVFTIDHYKVTKPDLDSIKPDTTYHDFQEILFEGLSDVYPEVQDLVAHSIVSSPKTLDRLGGLTLSVYNESKVTSRILLAYLRRFLPKEFLRQQAYHLSVEQIGHSIKLEPFPWMYKYLDADKELSKDALTLLSRPLDSSAPDEVMVSLESDYSKPKSLRDPPAAMADVPIVAANTLEKRRAVYDPSPEILKFIIATHLVPVSLPTPLYESSLGYLQEKITEISFKYPQFRSELGRGGILDLDIHGKPLSLLHLGLSDGRSNAQVEITKQSIEHALSIYECNMDNTLAIWQDAFPGDGKLDFSGTAPEQRRIAGYIYRHGPSTPEQVYEAVKNEMSRDSFYRWWKDLYDHGGIYEKLLGVFDIVPHYKE